MSAATMRGVLESIHGLPAVIDQEAFVRDCRAGDVAAGSFKGVTLMGWAPGAGMEGESQELSDTRVARRRVGRGGMQEGLVHGVGADGDAVVDGGGEEWLESAVLLSRHGGTPWPA